MMKHNFIFVIFHFVVYYSQLYCSIKLYYSLLHKTIYINPYILLNKDFVWAI